MDKSYPAQVYAVFDSTGAIHPIYFRFIGDFGELIKVRDFVIEKTNPEYDKIHRNFLCRSGTTGMRFVLSYNISRHSWSVETRDREDGYAFLMDHVT